MSTRDRDRLFASPSRDGGYLWWYVDAISDDGSRR
jgi:hypothetical protein